MKPLPILVFALLAIGCASAQASELSGRFGYLGEWEVAATLSESQAGPSRSRSYAGPLRLKHIGLCAPGESTEKSGHIRISIRPQGAAREPGYTARLTLDGDACEVSGALSQDRHSFANCGAQGQIPLRLWLRQPGPS